MPTIYDVAARAGVSPATVSRVLNGIAVSPSYAERVWAAAEELHFVPNRTARRLRRRRSEVIALIIPDIENPFFTALARAVEDRALEAGFSVVLCNSDERADKEARYLQVVLSEDMAGVVLAPAGHHSDLKELVVRGVPVVAADRPAHGYDLDTVLMDDVANGRAATEQLYRQGRSRVSCITGPRQVDTAEQRANGWREVFARRSPGVDPDNYIVHADYRVDGGRDAARTLLALAEPPDGLLITNNLMAVGALQAIESAAADVAVLSLGDLPFGMRYGPNVTVLSLPSRQLGITAADLLLARINGDRTQAHHVVVGTDI